MKRKLLVLLLTILLLPISINASGYKSKEIDINNEKIILKDIDEAVVDIEISDESPLVIKATSKKNERVIFRVKILSHSINTTYFYCDSEYETVCSINTKLHKSYFNENDAYSIAIEFIDYNTFMREKSLPEEELDSNISLFKEVDYIVINTVINKFFSKNISLNIILSDALLFMFSLITIVQFLFLLYLLFVYFFKNMNILEAKRTDFTLSTIYIIGLIIILILSIMVDSEVSFNYFIIDIFTFMLYIFYYKLIDMQYDIGSKRKSLYVLLILFAYVILIVSIQMIAIGSELFMSRLIVFTIFNLIFAINNIITTSLVYTNK